MTYFLGYDSVWSFSMAKQKNRRLNDYTYRFVMTHIPKTSIYGDMSSSSHCQYPKKKRSIFPILSKDHLSYTSEFFHCESSSCTDQTKSCHFFGGDSSYETTTLRVCMTGFALCPPQTSSKHQFKPLKRMLKTPQKGTLYIQPWMIS